MPRLPALIVAPAHSGTTYIASLLKLHGIAATHETFYHRERIFMELLEQEGSPVVDSSWFGLKWLDSHRDEIPLLVHLIRDPVKTARSWVCSPNLPQNYWDMLWFEPDLPECLTAGKATRNGHTVEARVAVCDIAVRATHQKIASYEPDMIVRVENLLDVQRLLNHFDAGRLKSALAKKADRNEGNRSAANLDHFDFPKCGSMARQCGYKGYEVKAP